MAPPKPSTPIRFPLSLSDLTDLGSSVKPVHGPVEGIEENAKRCAAKGGVERSRGDGGEVDISADQCKVRHGSRHEDELHIQSLFLVVTLLLTGVERDLRHALAGNRDSYGLCFTGRDKGRDDDHWED